MNRRSIELLAASLFLFASLATAEPSGEQRPKEIRAPRVAKHAHPKEAKTEAAPCPQGSGQEVWKDDPALFGACDPDALPVPSAHAVVHDPAPQPTIKPTANLNPRPTGPGPYQAGVVYQSNGNAVTSNYGGGVSIQLPF